MNFVRGGEFFLLSLSDNGFAKSIMPTKCRLPLDFIRHIDGPQHPSHDFVFKNEFYIDKVKYYLFYTTLKNLTIQIIFWQPFSGVREWSVMGDGRYHTICDTGCQESRFINTSCCLTK